MSFLAPGTAVLAALIALPILVFLYVLRLRRRMLRVPSTMLWMRTTEDLQVNTPFARFRPSVLFLLQALILLVLCLAAGQPVRPAPGLTAQRLVLLIDHSASMNAPADEEQFDAGVTRLDAALKHAASIVDAAAQSGSEVLIASFARRPQLESGFERRPAVLHQALERITPTDEEADLAAALEMAAAFFSGNGGEEELVILSDGDVRRTLTVPVARGDVVRQISFGHDETANVGIVAFSARRDYRDPADVTLFARLLSCHPEAVTALVALTVDGVPGATREVDIPAAAQDGEPGTAEIILSLDLPAGAYLELRVLESDDLPADNVAALMLEPPARPRVLLVHPEAGPDPLLERLLRDTQPQGLRPMTMDGYRHQFLTPAATKELNRRFDLVVLDRVADLPLPAVPSLGFSSLPAGETDLRGREPIPDTGQRIVSWDRQDPLLQYVALDELVYSGFAGYDTPAAWQVLARGDGGPVIIATERDERRHVRVGFELSRSSWPAHISLVVFLQNVMEYLAGLSGGRATSGQQPGDPLQFTSGDSIQRVQIEGPAAWEQDVEPASRFDLPGLPRAGRYAVRGATPFELALSVLSSTESDIRPRAINVATRGAVLRGLPEEGHQPLWPLLVVAALILQTIEWTWYVWRRRRL